MAIEDESPTVKGGKIDHITKLIQLYMVGVEALEGA